MMSQQCSADIHINPVEECTNTPEIKDIFNAYMCVCGCTLAHALKHWKNISREKLSGNYVYMTPAVTLRRSILTQTLVVFCIILTLNTHYFPRQYWPIGLYSGHALSLLWGRDWIFTCYLYLWFLKLWYPYHYWYANHVYWYVELNKLKNKNCKGLKTDKI